MTFLVHSFIENSSFLILQSWKPKSSMLNEAKYFKLNFLAKLRNWRSSSPCSFFITCSTICWICCMCLRRFLCSLLFLQRIESSCSKVQLKSVTLASSVFFQAAESKTVKCVVIFRICFQLVNKLIITGLSTGLYIGLMLCQFVVPIL